MPVDSRACFLADVGDTGSQDVIEQLLEGLLLQFGQCINQWLSYDFGFGPAPHHAGQRIRQLDDVVGSTQDDDRRRCLHEQCAKMLLLQFGLASGS